MLHLIIELVVVLLATPSNSDRVDHLTVAFEQGSEDVDSVKKIVILSFVVPAERIDEVHIVVLIFNLLIFDDINDSLNNLSKVVTNAGLCIVSTGLHVCEVVAHLHHVVTHGSLEPLHEVDEAFL